MATNMIVAVPVIKEREVKMPLLCGAGPTNVWPSVNEAYSKPVISPLCDEYFNVLDDLRQGIKYLFQTRSDLVLAMSGSGHCGMEAAITNLVEPCETMLIASRGAWDQRALEIANRHEIKAVITRVPVNATFSLTQLEEQLKQIRPTALFITHGDSSTGTVQNLQGLGDICHSNGCLLIVDAVVSLGAEPFFMDEWGVDAVYTSTQKALSGPAGISAIALSAKAQHKIKQRKHEPPFYLDIELLGQQWNCYGNTRLYHHTLSPPLLWALRACIKEISRETLPKIWERHANVMAHFTTRLEKLPVEFFVPKPEDRLVSVVTVVLPKGYDFNQFSKTMRETHNIMIFPGRGPTVGRALRIGLMGINATARVADAVADAIADTLRTLRKSSL